MPRTRTKPTLVLAKQKLEIAKIEGINEVEPATFEIVVSLHDGSRTILRMDALALQALANHVGSHQK